MKGFLRPEAEVLEDKSMIPKQNQISPAPNQFTHELTRAEPFYYAGPQQGRPPDGELPQGAKVVLLVYHGGQYCRVADGRGLYVEIEHAGLKKTHR